MPEIEKFGQDMIHKVFGIGVDDSNTATAASGAATLAKLSGKITTEALTTAAGATYTLTLTNTECAAADMAWASVDANGSTGAPVVTSVEPEGGSIVIKVQNIHASAAFNGALKISFGIIKALA